MHELDAITIRGFRSIKAIEDLKLRPINVIIGANGSGKSNFIGAFAFLQSVYSIGLDATVAIAGGANRLLHFGSKATRNIDLSLRMKSGGTSLDVSFIVAQGDRLASDGEKLRTCIGTGPDYIIMTQYPGVRSHLEMTGQALPDELSVAISGKTPMNYSDVIHDRVILWRVYHFHDTGPKSPLKTTNEVDDNRFLRPDGANLAAFLYYLHLKRPDSYSLIRRTIQRVAPFFEDFVLEPLRLNEKMIQLEWRHVGSEDYFDASSLSDGTLRFMALATLFLQPEELRPSIILVDEPELGLHPYAITLLASLVKQASVNSQVILSTQSSLLLDHFEPEDVLVAERVNGSTQIRRLEPEPLKVWLDDYSLGQLWEKNEIGGRPSGENSNGATAGPR